MGIDENVRTGRQCIFRMHVHLVFVAKYRHSVFADQHLTRCEVITRAVCEDFEAELVEFNGESNHVHLLVNFPPKAITELSRKGCFPERLRPVNRNGVVLLEHPHRAVWRVVRRRPASVYRAPFATCTVRRDLHRQRPGPRLRWRDRTPPANH
ncbi:MULTISPECIES: IS200/IS605 family transposase [Streptomyces]|uniref:IS200/IS605 family transposase n=1 Tax=Streptomyces lycopersici TaxID=2974589 RepID=UPI0021D25C16|nr:IS200/IS605 family transposase [Streptomyces sp. NEAU-383]